MIDFKFINSTTLLLFSKTNGRLSYKDLDILVYKYHKITTLCLKDVHYVPPFRNINNIHLIDIDRDIVIHPNFPKKLKYISISIFPKNIKYLNHYAHPDGYNVRLSSVIESEVYQPDKSDFSNCKKIITDNMSYAEEIFIKNISGDGRYIPVVYKIAPKTANAINWPRTFGKVNFDAIFFRSSDIPLNLDNLKGIKCDKIFLKCDVSNIKDLNKLPTLNKIISNNPDLMNSYIRINPGPDFEKSISKIGVFNKEIAINCHSKYYYDIISFVANPPDNILRYNTEVSLILSENVFPFTRLFLAICKMSKIKKIRIYSENEEKHTFSKNPIPFNNLNVYPVMKYHNDVSIILQE